MSRECSWHTITSFHLVALCQEVGQVVTSIPLCHAGRRSALVYSAGSPIQPQSREPSLQACARCECCRDSRSYSILSITRASACRRLELFEAIFEVVGQIPASEYILGHTISGLGRSMFKATTIFGSDIKNGRAARDIIKEWQRQKEANPEAWRLNL